MGIYLQRAKGKRGRSGYQKGKMVRSLDLYENNQMLNLCTLNVGLFFPGLNGPA
ncbi:predicted protein [Sclerotinia sclerotiorum 1980 UF-70]|uniref:Uncharacterized protein n=1 Tax=Sclerotinia sclerotiorum (strain ATCC 18683 / 1980 / Ss-1) TaxID=665079 RepID=A7F3W8_SCLS1|nr:predicted protein [Sclerotinia sclerotiorum 1980 UF-70]EDN97439.1 predicted protein [Sclerotinia sclerotiorum 1980 UF-70]